MLDVVFARQWRTVGGFARTDWVRFIGWLVCFTTLLFLVVSTRYLEYAHLHSIHAWVYLITAWIGQLSLLAVLLLLVLFPLAILLPYRVLILPLSCVLMTGGLLILVIDTAVYQLYRFHLSGFIWELLTSAGADEVIVLSLHTKLVVLGVLIGIGIVVWASVALATVFTEYRLMKGKRRFLLAFSLCCWLISQGVHIWYEAHYDMEIAGINRHLPAYYPMTGKRRLLEMGLLNPENVRPSFTLKSHLTESQLRYPVDPLKCDTPDRPMNVLVIVIDSLRADMWTPDILPRLTALSAIDEAHYFSRHISGGNVTKAGIFSLFYGLPANYWDSFASTATAPLWIRQHQAMRYEMGIFSSATLLSPAFDRTVFASIPDLRWHTEGNGAAERDLQTLKEFRGFLHNRNRQKPYFGFLFLDASHNYDVPEGYEKFQPQTTSVDHAKLDKNFDPVAFKNRYQNSLVFLDEQIGRLIDDMRDDSDLENTVLIITSDHGEQFNDLGQNFWGHGSNFTQYQVHVPLLVVWPGRAHAIHHYTTSHYDIAPTILHEVFGCTNNPADYATGGNLFDASFPRPWVLVNSYYNYGIVLKDRIVETFPLGWYEVLDQDNELMEDQSVGRDLAKQVLHLLSRYRN